MNNCDAFSTFRDHALLVYFHRDHLMNTLATGYIMKSAPVFRYPGF
jgi:hypothetical protein